ncbi:hypothetical protein IWW36_005076, partial [Coemansia brasiliensis]
MSSKMDSQKILSRSDASGGSGSNGSGSDSEPMSDSQKTHRRESNIEERRRQNRDAAARHRQRQQARLNMLAMKEAVLRQQVSELELELEIVRRSHQGLSVPQRDTHTQTLLDLLDSVKDLQVNLLQSSNDSQELLIE